MPTKYSSALNALLSVAQSTNMPRNGSSLASSWCWPPSSVPMTWPWLVNTATASGSTMHRVNLRMFWSGHL